MAGCEMRQDNLHGVFPGRQVRPRPQPTPTTKDNHNAWLQELFQAVALKCPSGRGYFCREHGSWISSEEVGSCIHPLPMSKLLARATAQT